MSPTVTLGSERGKTVMLLGAGASAASDSHLPTMAQFFKDQTRLGEQAKVFLTWYYQTRAPTDYNLEDVLAYLDTARTRTVSWNLATRGVDFPAVYDQMLQFIRSRLIVEANTFCLAHHRLFKSLKKTDSVITLNYDLVADRAMAEAEGVTPSTGYMSRTLKLRNLLQRVSLYGGGFAPGLMAAEREVGFYLKLHGSLNWVVCPTPGCDNNENWLVEGLPGSTEGYLGTPCRNCGATLEMLIVPPLATKRIQDRGRLAFLWRIALDELATCDRILIFGVSFAASDIDLRWLLRQAIAHDPDRAVTLYVVNPCKRAFDAVREMFRHSIPVLHCPDGLEQYYAATAL